MRLIDSQNPQADPALGRASGLGRTGRRVDMAEAVRQIARDGPVLLYEFALGAPPTVNAPAPKQRQRLHPQGDVLGLRESLPTEVAAACCAEHGTTVNSSGQISLWLVLTLIASRRLTAPEISAIQRHARTVQPGGLQLIRHHELKTQASRKRVFDHYSGHPPLALIERRE